MSDFRDVMAARSEAASRVGGLETYAGQLEDGERTENVALAVCLVGSAVCAELRALATTVDYMLGSRGV